MIIILQHATLINTYTNYNYNLTKTVQVLSSSEGKAVLNERFRGVNIDIENIMLLKEI